MDSKEILQRAVDKAIANGWDTPMTKKEWNSEALIYRHDFAKALWGDREWALSDSGKWYSPQEALVELIYTDSKQAWQYHLQQMVIAPDPIKYLGENI